MVDFYRCRYFKGYELVDKHTYHKFGENVWMFFNPVALRALDGIREYFDRPVIVNDWFKGGQLQFRGLRPPYCTTGTTYSQHRFGNAFDCTIVGMDAEDVRKIILQDKNHPLLKDITCIEEKVSWLHFDCRNISGRIWIIEP
jgi:hypothetical protein